MILLFRHDSDFEEIKKKTYEDLVSTRVKVREDTEKLKEALKQKQSKIEELKQQIEKYEGST